MSEKVYEAKIFTKAGGASITITVTAYDSMQARRLIELRPDFKSYAVAPKEVR